MERPWLRAPQWLWLMDDDVVVLPGAVAALAKWTGTVRLHPRPALDDAGRPFFWQHRFMPFLGIHVPVRGNVFRDAPVFDTNVGCFEGMLIMPRPRADRAAGPPATSSTAMTRSTAGLPPGPPSGVRQRLCAAEGPSAEADRPGHPAPERFQRPQPLLCHAEPRLHSPVPARTRPVQPRRVCARHRCSPRPRKCCGCWPWSAGFRGAGSLWRGWRESRTILRDDSWQPMPPLRPRPRPAPCPHRRTPPLIGTTQFDAVHSFSRPAAVTASSPRPRARLGCARSQRFHRQRRLRRPGALPGLRCVSSRHPGLSLAAADAAGTAG